METFVAMLVVVAPEGHGHLVAQGSVDQGRDRGGVAAVDPALLEGPHGRDDEVVPPVGGHPSGHPAGFQLDGVAPEGYPGVGDRAQQPQAVDVGPVLQGVVGGGDVARGAHCHVGDAEPALNLPGHHGGHLVVFQDHGAAPVRTGVRLAGEGPAEGVAERPGRPLHTGHDGLDRWVIVQVGHEGLCKKK